MEIIDLGLNEEVVGKPFSDFVNNRMDLNGLNKIAVASERFIRKIENNPEGLILADILGSRDGGVPSRIAVNSRCVESLVSQDIDTHWYWVGFCGQKRDNLSTNTAEQMEDLNADLIKLIPEHPKLLFYSSIDLFPNWKNLVVFETIEAIAKWNNMAEHRKAVALSPDYYKTIRLHSGVFNWGRNEPLSLLRTKYYSFESEDVWMAERVYG